jgi:enoyl-CoA hydratase
VREVRYSVSARIATITLHRPEVRNALSSALCRELRAALAAASADDGVDVLVLTGADPAFCAGLDLREYERLGRAPEGTAETILFAGELAKPLIGAVNGAAATGGLELALACDFLVASDRASFADTHTKVGVLPGAGLSVRLPQVVGLRRAKEMSFTGGFLDAREALRIGLVNHVVPHEELMTATYDLAKAVTTNQTEYVVAMKALYEHGSRLPFGAAFEHELALAAERRRRGGISVAADSVLGR